MLGKFLLLLAFQILGSHAWAVDLSEKENFKGTQISLTGSNEDCVDIPNDFHPQSIGTNGFCVRVFSEKKCQGETMGLFPASLNHGLLTKYDIAIKSLRSCRSAY